MRLVRLIGKMVPGIVFMAGLLLLSAGTGHLSRRRHRGGRYSSHERRGLERREVPINLDVQGLGTNDNCYANPGVAASGSGATVSYGGSSATDTSKNFSPNALVNKPILFPLRMSLVDHRLPTR